MDENKIKQTVEKILRIRNEKEVLNNLKRFGEFLAERGIVASEIVTDIIYTNEASKADNRFISFNTGYIEGASQRLSKALSDFGIGR